MLEGEPGFKEMARDFLHGYVEMMVGPRNAREVTQRIVELELDCVGLYLHKWDALYARALELEEAMDAFEDPNQRPCPFFIRGNCKYGVACRYSHENCETIKNCFCCKREVLGECKYGASCRQLHGCCREYYEQLVANA